MRRRKKVKISERRVKHAQTRKQEPPSALAEIFSSSRQPEPELGIPNMKNISSFNSVCFFSLFFLSSRVTLSQRGCNLKLFTWFQLTKKRFEVKNKIREPPHPSGDVFKVLLQAVWLSSFKFLPGPHFHWQILARVNI